MSPVEVDGSIGEGGGQIIRTSIALSITTNTPVLIYNIRKKRPNPGLQPQHYTGVKIASLISNADVEGLKIGSEFIRFHPKKISPNISKVDVGTAGSIPLILQTLIPAFAATKLSFPLEVIGGTDVKWSPTIDYMKNVFAPCLEALGIELNIEVKRRGYYPKGGGIVIFQVKNKSFPREFKFEKSNREVKILSICSNLPKSVAERQASTALKILEKSGLNMFKVVEILTEKSLSPGTSILVYTIGQKGAFIGADSVGEKGKPAERVGQEVTTTFLNETGLMPDLDSHLSDMIVPYLFLSPFPSKVRIPKVTSHLETNLYVSSLFIKRNYTLKKEVDGSIIMDISR
ncbi:MAG: RNA 3'-terminal phosphate cyclase [Nitrososphaeria archaeon]